MSIRLVRPPVRTPSDLHEHALAVEDAATSLADDAADLMADYGYSQSALAAAFGVTRQTIAARFLPGERASLDVNRMYRRVLLWHPAPRGVRVSSLGRFVVFHDGVEWRVLRHCITAEQATRCAVTLADECTGVRYVARPKALDAADLRAWRTPEGGRQ